jgi:hypothetical protein
VTSTLLDPKFLLRLLEARKPDEPPRPDASKMERELAALDAKRKRTVDLAVDGIIAKDELRERLAKLDNEARELRALLPVPAPAMDSRRVIEALARAFLEFGLLPFAEKRNILTRVFREFVIEGGGISSAALSGAFLADATTKVHPHTAPGSGWSAP